jgi:hypothetical protein
VGQPVETDLRFQISDLRVSLPEKVIESTLSVKREASPGNSEIWDLKSEILPPKTIS